MDRLDALPYDQKELLRLGMLSAELACSLPNVAHPQTLIKIMERFDMLIKCDVATASSVSSSVFLVPCLQLRVKEDQLEQADPRIPPIHFKCIPTTELESEGLEKKGFLPPGLFHRLISHCCAIEQWRHQRRLIFFDYMVFDAEQFDFALHMIHNGITLTASNLRGNPLALNELRKEIRGLIEQVLDQVFPNLSCMTFIPCSCIPAAELQRSSTQSPGFIQVTDLTELAGRKACPHRRNNDISKYQVWFGIDRSSLDVRALSPSGLKLNSELQPYMTTLLHSLSYKVRDLLMDENLLTLDENEAIEKESSHEKGNLKMYQIVLYKVRNSEQALSVKDSVCRGLCESLQFCPISKQYQSATTAQRNQLRKLRPHLTDIPLSDLSPLLDHLEQKEILDTHGREEIDAEKTRRAKVHKLLSIISHTHTKAHEDFFAILERTIWWRCQFGNVGVTAQS